MYCYVECVLMIFVSDISKLTKNQSRFETLQKEKEMKGIQDKFHLI